MTLKQSVTAVTIYQYDAVWQCLQHHLLYEYCAIYFYKTTKFNRKEAPNSEPNRVNRPYNAVPYR